MTYDIIGFVFIVLVALTATAILGLRGRAAIPPALWLAAVFARVAGTLLRYVVLHGYYGGVGDTVSYYQHGLTFAEQVWAFEMSPFDVDQWFGRDVWWGTPFVGNLIGLLLMAIGPTPLGASLVFSMLAFIGVMLMITAAQRVATDLPMHRLFAVCCLWPSVCYWPSSLGKEALFFFGLGVAVLGFVGKHGRTNWLMLLAGIGFVFTIRPHAGALLAASAAVGAWVGNRQSRARAGISARVILTGLAVAAVIVMGSRFEISDADREGLEEVFEYRSQKTLKGGSMIGGLPTGAEGLPVAIVSAWMRPFPWAIHNFVAGLAALEVLAFWILVWRYRAELRQQLRHWRSNKLLCLTLPLLAGYTLLLGYGMGNEGIIARQRSPMFPLLFIVLLGGRPVTAPKRSELPMLRPSVVGGG